MDLFEAIKKRASYRGNYTDEKIPKADMNKILWSAINAPSGANKQTTSFVVVDDEILLKKLATLVPKAGMDSAPCVIAVIADTEAVYHGMSFYKEDYSAAVLNIYLAATALGYATCWLDGVLRLNDVHKKVSRLLNVPDDKLTCVLLPIGVPAQENKTKEKKSIGERVCYNTYSL